MKSAIDGCPAERGLHATSLPGEPGGLVPGLRGGHQEVPRRAAPKWCPRGHVPMAA